MGSLEGQVAFITGAARGQGRNHAVRLAERGVDVIALDINASIPTVAYGGPTADDLAETVRLVEGPGGASWRGRPTCATWTRSAASSTRASQQLGRLDIVIPNAGIASIAPAREMSDQTWHDIIDINLNGAWHTVTPRSPPEGGRERGSIVLIGSVASSRAFRTSSTT